MLIYRIDETIIVVIIACDTAIFEESSVCNGLFITEHLMRLASILSRKQTSMRKLWP